MKRILFLLLLIFTATIEAQQKENEPKSESKAVEFSGRSGSLITKTFYPLESIGELELKVLLLKDEIKQEKIACLRAEVISYATNNTYIGTLDSDEISDCIKALEFIKNTLIPTKPTEYMESSFKTKDGVEFGAYFSKKEWTIFVQTKSYSSYSIKRMKEVHLDLLISKLKEASEKIKSLQ